MAKVTPQVRQLVVGRNLGRCERCNGLPEFGGMSVHHRTPRGMGGSREAWVNQPANLILLCGSGVTGCHGWVESNRDQARANGYLLYRSQTPSEVPFIDTEGNRWCIDDDGCKTLCD